MGGNAPGAPVGIGNPGSTPSYFDESRAAANARALSARTAHPSQTPVIRRTGAIQPIVAPEKKKSWLPSVFIGLLLLGVIAWGANKLQPVFRQAQEFHEAQKREVQSVADHPASGVESGAETSPAVAEPGPASGPLAAQRYRSGGSRNRGRLAGRVFTEKCAARNYRKTRDETGGVAQSRPRGKRQSRAVQNAN